MDFGIKIASCNTFNLHISQNFKTFIYTYASIIFFQHKQPYRKLKLQLHPP